MTSPLVSRSTTVAVEQERAFDLFVGRLGDFKPPEHNLLATPIAETVFEPWVGGSILDRSADGSECRWGRVLAFDRPHRVVFSWNIGPTWQLVSDPSHASEVEVRFVAEGVSSPRASRRLASTSSTVTWTGTAPGGKRSAPASMTTPGGRCTSHDSVHWPRRAVPRDCRCWVSHGYGDP